MKHDPTARSIAFELLNAVDIQSAYANLLLPRLLSSYALDSRESSFAQELAFGTLRNRLFYDRIIEVASSRDASSLDVDVLNLLRLGAHQLLNMRVPAHAAISETVNLAKSELKPGLSGLVNAVLRRVSEKSLQEWKSRILESCPNDLERLSIEYSHPLWIVRALADALAADGRASDLELLLQTNNLSPAVNLVALPGLGSVDDLFDDGAVLEGVSPIGATVQSGDPAILRTVRSSRARVQDQGSQLATIALVEAPVLSGSDSEEWLDLCAGPGGKAALLAAYAVERRAELTCNELQPHRALLVQKALEPIDPDVYVRTGDGRDLGEDAPESFDRILIDAPCSGLGAIRRRPESRYRKSNSDLAQLTELQTELFRSGFKGLKVGGVLAYVTCSPHLAETSSLVDWARREFAGQIELLDATKILETVAPKLKTDSHAITAGRKTVQLWPQIHDTDGMFISLFRKVSK